MACRTCFWSAELSRTGDTVWCSHRIWHGWHREPACAGDAYQFDDR